MKIFYLIYVGRPRKNNTDKSIAGGLIGCWIEASTMLNADKIAKRLIAEQDWEIIKKDQFKTIKPNSISKDSDHFQYYEQVLIDKTVLVFYTYPKRKKRSKTHKFG